jgi:hypothetical protein
MGPSARNIDIPVVGDCKSVLQQFYKVIAAFGGRVLRVVHRPEGDDIVVITMHFDRGARR